MRGKITFIFCIALVLSACGTEYEETVYRHHLEWKINNAENYIEH